MRGNKGGEAQKIEEMKGGWMRVFHIKAFSVISPLKNTEMEDIRRFTVDARACGEWRGGHSFFRVVAMASPEAMGRNGTLFCAHPCQHLIGGMGF